jgi:elongation factor P
MATVGMGDIKKGVRLIVGEVPCKVVEFQHVKPGKGAKLFMQAINLKFQ